MNKTLKRLLLGLVALFTVTTAGAQEKIVNPDIT